MNVLEVPLPSIVDTLLTFVGDPFKVALYFLSGFYLELDVTSADMRLISTALGQRATIQALLCVLVYFIPFQHTADRQAIVLAILSPIGSMLMHIMAEHDYGDHLVKLCITAGLVNVLSSTLFQHFLIELQPLFL
mmetsp:Transcript_46943/g.86044  ORF Transcript_46943/g.86044 Transcript_46943/m.86044 type:complete len:135 (+) Transcript_46943:74-478(+)